MDKLILTLSLCIFVIEFSKTSTKNACKGVIMKNLTVLTLLLGIVFAFLVLTGFQCGSTEMTSAKLYIQRSDWPSAEKALAKEVEMNPKNAEAWYYLGFARMQMKKFEDALTAFNQSLQAGNEFSAKVNEAKHFGWQQTLNNGVSKYNASLNTSKDSAEALRQQAIASYKLAIAYEPDSSVSYHRMAVAQLAEGNYDDEISYLKQGLDKKKDPEYYRMIINSYTQKGQDLDAKGNKQEAIANYENAISVLTDARKLDPNDADLLGMMINLYISAGRASDAKPSIREALEREPQNKVYQYDLGVLLMQSDSLDAALEHFQAALAVDSNYQEALRNAALAHMKKGERMKEVAGVKAGSKKDTEIDKSYQEEFKQSVWYLERLTSVKSDDPNLWDALATAYGNAGMYKDVKGALEKADALRKKNP